MSETDLIAELRTRIRESGIKMSTISYRSGVSLETFSRWDAGVQRTTIQAAKRVLNAIGYDLAIVPKEPR